MCSTSRSIVLFVVAIFSLFVGWPSRAMAQQDALTRIDAIYLLSERDNGEALKQIRSLGAELGTTTPYSLQRVYLERRIVLELDSGQIDAAKTSIAQLLAQAQSNRDNNGIALAMTFEATVMAEAAKLDSAITKLQMALPLAEQAADSAVLWRHYLVLGNVQRYMGKFELALGSYFKCLQYADQHPRYARQFRLHGLGGQGAVYLVMKNPGKALAVIDEALVLAKELDSRKMLAMLYINQGYAYADLGRSKESAEVNARALKITQDSGLVRMEVIVLSNIGDSYLGSHDYAKAEPVIRQALEKFSTLDDQGGVAIAMANLGMAWMGQGLVTRGTAEVRAALTRMHAANAKADEEVVLGELGHMYEQLGMYRQAVSTIREQQQLSEQLFRADREKTVATLQEQFDAGQRQKQIELLARDNRLKDVELHNQRLREIVTLLGTLATIVCGIVVFLLYRRTQKANEQLHGTNRQLEFHAVRDPLTGLYNRRSFFDLMNKRSLQTANGRREDESPDGLMILDIDHFKCINDTLGHAGGDAVLLELAKRLRSTVRDEDMVIRWGGEEFLVYAPKVHTQHLQSLAQRVLKVVGETPMSVNGQMIRITVTGGFLSLPFSGMPESECNWEKAVHIADSAMYLGKRNGRNRVYGLSSLLVPFEQAMPALTHDIAAALKATMVELIEVLGPEDRSALTLKTQL
jgi:diguanylate cyclase (GGDEF)-like protein